MPEDDISITEFCGRWAHVPEEDTVDSMVFRRAEDAPRRRGGLTLDLKQGGEAAISSIGRNDRRSHDPGHWTYDPKTRHLTLNLADGTTEQLTLISAAADKLVAEKKM
jgi:hypothetical protein